MKIFFATSNEVKLSEFREFLLPRGIEVERIDIEIPEMRHEDVAQVAREKARYAAIKTGKAVVAEDTGLYISALKGFPGTCAKFVFYTIGLEGILKLMEDAKDRSAEFRTAIALAEPRRDRDKALQSAISTQEGKEPKVFLGIEKGTIAESVRCGAYGYDPVFIPEGHTKTYAEDYDTKKKISHRAKALGQLAEFLKKK